MGGLRSSLTIGAAGAAAIAMPREVKNRPIAITEAARRKREGLGDKDGSYTSNVSLGYYYGIDVRSGESYLRLGVC